MNTDNPSKLNLKHSVGYPLALNIGDDQYRADDLYQLAATDFDNMEAFRVEGTWRPNHVSFPRISDTPTGTYRYAVIRTRSGLPEKILEGVLTIIPSVQP